MNLITFDYNTIDVHAQGGILVTTSRNVAQVFGKEHKNAIRDIREIIESNSDEEFGRLNFELSSYRNEQNKEQPEYLLTRDGTMLLIMGYTGEKALALKTAYIKRFNEMEQALKSQAERASSDQVQQLMSRAQFLLSIVGIEGNQMALALDKLHKDQTGKSLLAMTGVQLVRPQQVHLACPTEIGKCLTKAHNLKDELSGQAINKILAAKGYQERINGVWTATEAGKAAGATYLDVNKAHSKGTPVTQLKWPIDILDNLTF